MTKTAIDRMPRPATNMPVTEPAWNATPSAGAEAGAGRLGRAHVRADGDAHARVAGSRRGDTADHEAERGLPVEEQREQNGDDDTGDADRRVLPLEERLCALLDRAGDLLHTLVAGG